MDVTTLFKACVKTARLKNKSLTTTAAEKTTTTNRSVEKRKTTAFTEKTRTISHQLTQLRDCLLENRSAYMKFGCHLKGVAQKMTDQERDLIDGETDKILTICTQLIIELRHEVKSYKAQGQKAEYMENVLESLTTYLKNVFGISNQMRTYRVKKELETYKLLKLKADKRDIPETPKLAKQREKLKSGDGGEGLRRRKNRRKSRADEERRDSRDGWDIETLSDAELANNNKSSDEEDALEDDNYDSGTDAGDFIAERSFQADSSSRRSIPSKLALDEEIAADRSYNLEEEEQQAHELSPEDVQMFELENKQLLSELKGLSEEISQIEKNVTEIAKLQDLFTEKVTLQQSDIDRISNTVVGVTENVKDANDQIREAIQRNAGLRVYILFFLLVMSFSLLFLHWYND